MCWNGVLSVPGVSALKAEMPLGSLTLKVRA